MEIKATPNNLTNLISNLLIRLRNKNIESDLKILNDLKLLVSYLDKISDESLNEDALHDKNFITSTENLKELSSSISHYPPERINAFKESIPDKLDILKKTKKIEELKEHLRKVAGVFISFKNIKTYE